jgi:hypothetical protein
MVLDVREAKRTLLFIPQHTYKILSGIDLSTSQVGFTSSRIAYGYCKFQQAAVRQGTRDERSKAVIFMARESILAGSGYQALDL